MEGGSVRGKVEESVERGEDWGGGIEIGDGEGGVVGMLLLGGWGLG